MSRRFLVTGAAGLVGFDLCRRLLASGERVLGVDIGEKGGLDDLEALARSSGGALELARVDLAADGAASAPALRGPFDGVFHLAAIVGVAEVTRKPYRCSAVNLRSTLNALDLAIRDCRGPFVFASSSECYAAGVDAGLLPVPTPEAVTLSISDSALPRWSYAASKIAGEAAVFGAAVEHAHLRPIVVRFHNIYGPRMRPTHVVPEMLERCARKVDPFPVFGPEQTRAFLHVADAARALELLVAPAQAQLRGIVNIGSSEETRIGELLELVLEITGHRPRIATESAPPGSVGRRAPDVSKLTAMGFRPSIGLRAGIEECWRARRERSS